MYYYEIAPRIIVRSNIGFFTYESEVLFTVGQLVTIPIGNRTAIGVILRFVQKPSFTTKRIISHFDLSPLPIELIALAEWISNYHHTPLATTLQMIIPTKLTVKRRQVKSNGKETIRSRTQFVLNENQQLAVTRIESMTPGSALIYGVTGSGKTAIYIELTKRAINRGQSVIILVPEIALTSQIVDEFKNEFNQSHPDIPITLYHSKQTEAARAIHWRSVLDRSHQQNGSQAQIIVGPRSSLFLPVTNLGLVIVDECHEPSYKQDQSPRYSALRVASVLAKLHSGKTVLGSATPSVADYYLAQASKRPIIHLPSRAKIDAVAPDVCLVDMTKRVNFKSHWFLSTQLLKGIHETLESGKQVLLYHNRRGTSSFTLCESCGWSAACQRCFIPLTLHADKHSLLCHICGMTEHVPTACPVCKNASIIHKGIGTKLIETELKKIYPNKKVMRFDGDSSTSSSLDTHYKELYSGEIDIIIGTQTVAKGLDLPHLRLVGVIQADSGLALPDFSSEERVFQLLAQVIGRVGRSNSASKVIVQSFQSSHPAVQLGLTQNYDEFYKHTLLLRKKGHFPPFTYLLKITCRYKSEKAAISNARKVTHVLKSHLSHHDTLLGPTPAFYERSGEWYQWQLIIRSPVRAGLVALINHVPTSGNHWQIELDPISLL